MMATTSEFRITKLIQTDPELVIDPVCLRSIRDELDTGLYCQDAWRFCDAFYRMCENARLVDDLDTAGLYNKSEKVGLRTDKQTNRTTCTLFRLGMAAGR